MKSLMIHIAKEELKALEIEREYLKQLSAYALDEQRIDLLEKIEEIDADICIIHRNLVTFNNMMEIEV